MPARRLARALSPWLLLGAALALFTVLGGAGSGLPAGGAAPPLLVPWTASSEPFVLAEQRGHVTVLAFWATWCPACRAEGPALSRLADRIAPHHDRVVGVSVDTAPLESVARTARALGMTYPIALAPRAAVDRFAVSVLPTVIVVGPDARIAESFSGTVSEERLLRAVHAARR